MISTKGREHIASVKRAGSSFDSTVIYSMWKHRIRTNQEHHKRRKHGAADKLAPKRCITRRQTFNTFNDSKVMRFQGQEERKLRGSHLNLREDQLARLPLWPRRDDLIV